MARQVALFNVHASLQNWLMSRARRLQKAKNLINRGEAEVARIRAEVFAKFDDMYGENTQIIFECAKDMPFMRMSRIVQEPREFDVDALRERLTPGEFAMITKTVVDVKALDVALARRRVDSRIVAECTHYGVRPNFTLEATGPKSEVKPSPGQIAVVSSAHLATVAVQES